MKKRFLTILLVMIMLVSTIGVLTAQASASVSFSGSSTVEAGKTYTYKYTLKVSSSVIANINIAVGGCITKVSGGENLFYDTTPNNTSGNVSGSITIKVNADAKPGDTGYISADGNVTTIIDDALNSSEKSITGAAGITVGTPSAATAKPSSTKKPDSKATADASPTPSPTPTEWELLATNIASMDTAGTVTMDITENTQLPTTILSSLIEKQGTLTLNFGEYTCTINGADLTAIPADLTAIDLSLSMEKDPAFSEAVGGSDVYQLHFSYSGQLPGKFTYKFKAADSSPGDTVYLYYYYDQAGVIEGQQSAVVDDTGYVTFEIYHCSSYFVASDIIAGAMNNFADPADAQALQDALDQNETLKAQLETAQQEAVQAADTLSASAADSVGQLFGVSIIALVAALVGVALLAIFGTMFFCKVGIFKKKESTIPYE